MTPSAETLIRNAYANWGKPWAGIAENLLAGEMEKFVRTRRMVDATKAAAEGTMREVALSLMADGPITAVDMASMMSVPVGTLTRPLHALIDAGLVARRKVEAGVSWRSGGKAIWEYRLAGDDE